MTPLQNNRTGLTDYQLIERYVWEGLHGSYTTKAAAARLLKVSRQTIYNMIADGRLQTIPNGRVTMHSIYKQKLERSAV